MARTVARRRFAAVRSPQRRGRTWARHVFTQTFASAGPPVAFDLLGPWATQVGVTLPGLTVGPIFCHLDHFVPANTNSFFFGIIVANREAIAGDITAWDPSQVADRTLDWMLWRHIGMGTVAAGENIQHIDYQTMSRRKIERVGESLFFIGRATAANQLVDGGTSTLVLLP